MKLSEIKYKDLICKTTKNDLEQIVFEKENSQVQEKCDVGFIFGGVSMLPYRVDKGIELYQNGLVDKLLVSGGVGFMNTDRKTPEALKMYDYLREHDIPDKDIIVESFSRNTVENIQNSLTLLKEKYDIDKSTYALVTSDFHVRRCLGLFASVLGHRDTLFGSGVKDGKTDIDSWDNNFYGKRMIYQEAIALCMYAKQSRLEDLEIGGLELTKTK